MGGPRQGSSRILLVGIVLFVAAASIVAMVGRTTCHLAWVPIAIVVFYWTARAIDRRGPGK